MHLDSFFSWVVTLFTIKICAKNSWCSFNGESHSIIVYLLYVIIFLDDLSSSVCVFSLPFDYHFHWISAQIHTNGNGVMRFCIYARVIMLFEWRKTQNHWRNEEEKNNSNETTNQRRTEPNGFFLVSNHFVEQNNYLLKWFGSVFIPFVRLYCVLLLFFSRKTYFISSLRFLVIRCDFQCDCYAKDSAMQSRSQHAINWQTHLFHRFVCAVAVAVVVLKSWFNSLWGVLIYAISPPCKRYSETD